MSSGTQPGSPVVAGVPIAHSGVAAGATNMPNPGPDAPSEVQAVRNELSGSSDWDAVRSLAAILEPEAFDWKQPADEGWRERTQWVAIAHASKVISEGWRRVSEDDDTVERVARAIHDVGCGSDDLCKGYDSHGEWDRRIRDDSYEAEARAAVQALRDGGAA